MNMKASLLKVLIMMSICYESLMKEKCEEYKKEVLDKGLEGKVKVYVEAKKLEL